MRIKKYIPQVILCLYILCSSVFFSGCKEDASIVDADKDISQVYGSGDFTVGMDEVETSAKGSIITYEKDENVLGIKIVAFIHVDSEDWGGVAFQIPKGCKLEELLNTYPNSMDSEDKDHDVNIWTTGSDGSDYSVAIEIGRSRSRENTGGGEGTVVIDLSYSYDDINDVNELPFGIECGASDEDGSVVWGKAHEEIVVEVNP